MQGFAKSSLAKAVFKYLRDERYISAAKEFGRTCAYVADDLEALELGIKFHPLTLSLSAVFSEYAEIQLYVDEAFAEQGWHSNETLIAKIRNLVERRIHKPTVKRQLSPEQERPSKRFRGGGGGNNSSIFMFSSHQSSTATDETETEEAETQQEIPVPDVATVKDACMTIPNLPQLLSETINDVKNDNENISVDQIVEEALVENGEEDRPTPTPPPRELRNRPERPDYKQINVGAKIPPKSNRGKRPKMAVKKAGKKGRMINVLSHEIIQPATSAPLPVAELVQQSEPIDINSCAIVFFDSEAPQVVQVQQPQPSVASSAADSEIIIIEETTPQIHQPIEPKIVSSTSSRKSSHIRNLSFTTPAKELDVDDESRTEVTVIHRDTAEEERPKSVVSDPLKGINEWNEYRQRYSQGIDSYLREENSKAEQQQKTVKKVRIRKKKTETPAEVKEEISNEAPPVDSVEEVPQEEVVENVKLEKIYFKVPTPAKKTPAKIRPTQSLPSPKSSPEDISLSNSMIQAAANLEAQFLSGHPNLPSTQVITTVHGGVHSDEYAAALSLSSMSFNMEKTPFKSEFFDMLPITPADPNFMANQTVETPLTKFINEMGCNSLMKDMSSISTPMGPTPITPGTGHRSPSTESKSVGGYSSAASSYYRPDDNDKLLEKQINSDQMKATAEKLKLSSKKKETVVEVAKTPMKGKPREANKRKSREALDEAERNAVHVAALEEKKNRTIMRMKMESERQRGRKFLATQKKTKFLSKLPTPRKKGKLGVTRKGKEVSKAEKVKKPTPPKPTDGKMSLRPKSTPESKISPIPKKSEVKTSLPKNVPEQAKTPTTINSAAQSTPIEQKDKIPTTTTEIDLTTEDLDENYIFSLVEHTNNFDYVYDESQPTPPPVPSTPLKLKPARIKFDDFSVVLAVTESINLYESRPGRRTRHSSGSFKEIPKVMETTKISEFGTSSESSRPISPPQFRDFYATSPAHMLRSPAYVDEKLTATPKINVRAKEDVHAKPKSVEKSRMPLKIDMKQNNQVKIDSAKSDRNDQMIAAVLQQVHGS